MFSNIFDTSVHIPSLSIRGFRGVADLTIPQLARVTLITGMNNTGKTSILEGIRLLTDEASPDVISEILQFREENNEGLSNDIDDAAGGAFLVSALFHGFPQLSDDMQPIVISYADGSRQVYLEIGWFAEIEERDGRERLVPVEQDLFGFQDGVPALVVTTEFTERVYPLSRIDRLASDRRSRLRYNRKRVSTRFVSSSGPERTEMVGPLWDNISLTPKEDYVIEALRIIDPSISAVSMIGEQSIRSTRTAVVRSENFGRRVPLRSFGEGMNRLFSIILSLVNVSGGVLLIDEFENGMHYSVQVDAWRMVFRLAQELNVQVLATTHSIDCVAGFRQAAAELEQVDGLLVRIDRFGGLMRVVEYTEEDLLVAINQRIEVR